MPRAAGKLVCGSDRYHRAVVRMSPGGPTARPALTPLDPGLRLACDHLLLHSEDQTGSNGFIFLVPRVLQSDRRIVSSILFVGSSKGFYKLRKY